MGAAVVLREQLDVLVVLASVDFVLDVVVREVNLAIGLYATLPISRTYLTASPLFVRSIPSKVNR
jgi:hypothetical protein